MIEPLEGRSQRRERATEQPQRPGTPLLDRRARWWVGWGLLGVAALATGAAFLGPLRPGAPLALRVAHTLLLGGGLAAAALLASLKGRGRGEQYALYGFLALACDGFVQVLGPNEWSSWPLFALLVASAAVAEDVQVALGVALWCSVLAWAGVRDASPQWWHAPAIATAGYAALAIVVNRSLATEKRRLSGALSELARLKHGIEQLDDVDGAPTTVALPSNSLKQVSEEGRRQRQADRAQELERTLATLVDLARESLPAHSVVYLEVDHLRELAYVRAACGPPSLVRDATLPLGQDPLAFVLDRKSAFYATDYKRMLWSLPYYKGEMRIGTLLAVPVRVSEVVSGVLIADRTEIQAFTGREPDLLEGFASLAAEEVGRARATVQREELGAEFKAIYEVSSRMAALVEPAAVRQRLLQSARDLTSLDGAAVVICDEEQTRYHVEDAFGWATEFMGREVALAERTWTAWVLRSGEEAYLLDSVAEQQARMPVLVLDEAMGPAGSLLVRVLRARNRTLGALVLTGRKGVFDAGHNRVLGILANQAAATLSVIQLKERHKELAVRDGLTGLYNRRAFNDLLTQALARQDRQGGHVALVILDLDHFKKLNDTYGHPAGDAALRRAAQVLEQHLRKGDQAARYGGEEFAAILPLAEAEGAQTFAERVRSAFEKGEIVHEGARLRLTASFGVAVWPEDGASAEGLLASADRALYAAKGAGRNRVVLASSTPTAPPPVES